MGPAGGTVRLNWMYLARTKRSWTDGMPWPASRGPREHLARPGRNKSDPRRRLRGTEALEAVMASLLPAVVSRG